MFFIHQHADPGSRLAEALQACRLERFDDLSVPAFNLLLLLFYVCLLRIQDGVDRQKCLLFKCAFLLSCRCAGLLLGLYCALGP